MANFHRYHFNKLAAFMSKRLKYHYTYNNSDAYVLSMVIIDLGILFMEENSDFNMDLWLERCNEGSEQFVNLKEAYRLFLEGKN